MNRKCSLEVFVSYFLFNVLLWLICATASVASLFDGTVEAYCDGVPIISYWRTYLYSIPPDFEKNCLMQEDNNSPQTKISLKKSAELKDNFIGLHHNAWPCSPQGDYQPFLPVFIIDGDPNTGWASRGNFVPDYEPEWVRIDLPYEAKVILENFL